MAKVPVIDSLKVGLNNPSNSRFISPDSGGQQPIKPVNASPTRGSQVSAMDNVYGPVDNAPNYQMQTAKAIGRAAEMAQGIILDMQKKADTARVASAQNEYIRYLQDQKHNVDTGWSHQRGEHALFREGDKPLHDEYGVLAQEKKQEILSRLSNDRQKQLFAEFADSSSLRQREQIMSHVSREFAAYSEQTNKASLSIAQNMITSGDERDIEDGMAKIRQTNQVAGELNGWSDDVIGEKNRADSSAAIVSAVAQRIEQNELSAASGILNRYDAYLTGKDRYLVTKTLQSALDIKGGKSAAMQSIQSTEVTYDSSAAGDPYTGYNSGFNLATAKQRLIGAESGGSNTAKNPKSSATGRGQFIKSTWRAFGKSAIGGALKGNKTDAQWLAMRADPSTMDKAIDWYFGENQKALRKAGVPFNNTTAYLAHFLGSGGAVKVYKAAPETPISEIVSNDVMKANSFLRGKTAADVVAWAARKMGVKYRAEVRTTKDAKGQEQTVYIGASPDKPVFMTNAQLKKYVTDSFPNQPEKQQSFIDTYTTSRDAAVEQQKAQKDTAFNNAFGLLAEGGNLSDISPTTLVQLDAEDRRKLQKAKNQFDKQDNAQIEAQGYMAVSELSKTETLEKISEADINRLFMEEKISKGQHKMLLSKKRKLAEKGKEAVFALDNQYPELKLSELIEKYVGIDTFDSLDEKEKRQLALINYRVQELGQRFVDMARAESKPFNQEDFTEVLIKALQDSVTIKQSFWGGERKKQAITRPLLDDGVKEEKEQEQSNTPALPFNSPPIR